MSLKEILTKIRQDRNITAVQMAISLNITPSYLSQIENKLLTPDWFIDRTTKALSLTPDEIKVLSDTLESIKTNQDSEYPF